MPSNKKWFWLAAMVAAWLFDFLFWSKPIGVSFFIWLAVLMAAGFLLAGIEGKRPSWRSLLIAVLTGFFASVNAWRGQEMIRMISALLAFGGLLLLAATFLNGFWPWYRLRDYIVEFMRVLAGGFTGGMRLLNQPKEQSPSDGPGKKTAWRRLLPILRGVLIALPIVAVLGVLLSSADPVFGDWMKQVFNLEKLPEYLFRLFYILVIGFILVGVYLNAVHPSGKGEKPAPNTPWVKTFLGWTETGIILGAVVLLFLTFIFIQVRYLFGGAANISGTGYTYAEYARRGFGELLGVAALSLMLYLVLGSVAKIESRFARSGFKVLAVALMASVLVILASSLQRLMLYEDAYGFSQLRTYTHILIVWLAALIAVTIVFELLSRRGHFALALLACVVGFGITLAVINVDGFIIDRNVARARAGSELDVNHINSLSTDAVPALLRNYQSAGLPQEVKDGLGAALACRQKLLEDTTPRPWQAFNFSQARAAQLLKTNSQLWNEYHPYKDQFGSWKIFIEGEPVFCNGTGYGMD